MQDLIMLVKAVRLVNTDSVGDAHDFLDGKIRAEGTGIDLGAEPIEVQGRDLLEHTKNVSPEGLYLTDSDRSK